MSIVRTGDDETGWGLMCPGCYAVISAEDTGLRPLVDVSDLAFFFGWQYVEFDSGYERDGLPVPGSGGYVCPMCVEGYS